VSPQNLGGYVTDLTFDGTELQPEDGSFVFWFVRGSPGTAPLVRGRDVVIPHAAGRIARSRQADLLPIEIEGRILASTPGGYRQTVRGLMTLFDGVAEPRALACLLEDGTTTAEILARPVPPVLLDDYVASHAARINVAFEAVAPYWTIEEGS